MGSREEQPRGLHFHSQLQGPGPPRLRGRAAPPHGRVEPVPSSQAEQWACNRPRHMAVGAGKRVTGETSAALGLPLPRAPVTAEGGGADSSPYVGPAPQSLLGPPEMPWLQRHRRLMGWAWWQGGKREAGRGRQAGIRKGERMIGGGQPETPGEAGPRACQGPGSRPQALRSPCEEPRGPWRLP